MVAAWCDIVDFCARFMATRERYSMELLMQKATEGVLGSGPLALVLGAAIVVLWRENKALQERLLSVLERIVKEGGK
jgi:hypothetical protein